MKIAILGTRGIPNYHGGFEQFAESISEYLVHKGHDVTVYNSHKHPFKENTWRGVKIVHKYDPEHTIGTAGQFIYDLNCILHSRAQKFDVILQLGYTSSSIWSHFFPKRSTIVTNMDGLEWKRSKYNQLVQQFLKYAEGLAVKHSDFLVADSIGIKNYLFSKYKVESKYIAYGAKYFEQPNIEVLGHYGLTEEDYNLLIARLEPENNIEMILDGVVQSKKDTAFLVIGKHETKYGIYLKEKYKQNKNILFLGGIYNQYHLDNLRYYSNLYFHGHSVGGTNPSLLEAMASGAFIIANDNIFNRSILGKDAFYFSNEKDVENHLNLNKADYRKLVNENGVKIQSEFTSEMINKHYEDFMQDCLTNQK